MELHKLYLRPSNKMIRLQYIHAFRRAMDTFAEMMNDRGCKDPILRSGYKEWVESMIKETLEDQPKFFHKVFNKYKDESSDVHVMVSMIRKPKLAQLRTEMKNNINSRQLIVLSLFPMSNNNEKYLSPAIHPHMKIQLFYCHNLQVNITKHSFVPKHTITPSSIIDDMGMTPEEFPLLSRKDPIVLYYDFPVGSVITIERNVPMIGNTTYYRWIR